MNTKRIMLVGKICGGPIDWSIAPLPQTQTDEPPFVSKAIMRQMPIGTSSDLFWDGFYAYCEGQPLAAMPTEQQETGWWHANMSRGEAEQGKQDGTIEDDHDDIRKGGSGMGLF